MKKLILKIIVILPLLTFFVLPNVNALITFNDIKTSWAASISGTNVIVLSSWTSINDSHEYINVMLPNPINSVSNDTIISLWSPTSTYIDSVRFNQLSNHLGNNQTFYKVEFSNFVNYDIDLNDYYIQIQLSYPMGIPFNFTLSSALQNTNTYFYAYYPDIITNSLTFEDGYRSGYDIGYNESYYNAYDDIYNELYNDLYDTWFDLGVVQGESNGYEEYYMSRYNQGLSDASEGGLSILGFVPGILGAVNAFFFQVASIEFLGISPLDVIAAFAVIAVALIVFKVFLSK